MARTTLTPTQLSRNDSVDSSTAYASADATNGMAVAAGQEDKMVLHVKNGDTADHTVTVSAGVYERSGIGNLAVTVPAGGERIIGPLESMRFEQSDENIYLDFDAGTSVTIAAFVLP